jgi:hypothetical protein
MHSSPYPGGKKMTTDERTVEDKWEQIAYRLWKEGWELKRLVKLTGFSASQIIIRFNRRRKKEDR